MGALLDLTALRLKAITAGLEPGKFTPDEALQERYDLRVLFTDRPTGAAGVRPIAEVATLAADGDVQPVDPVRYTPADVTTLKFTSGSTGAPKGLAAWPRARASTATTRCCSRSAGRCWATRRSRR